jgi:hypothetical protein
VADRGDSRCVRPVNVARWCRPSSHFLSAETRRCCEGAFRGVTLWSDNADGSGERTRRKPSQTPSLSVLSGEVVDALSMSDAH